MAAVVALSVAVDQLLLRQGGQGARDEGVDALHSTRSAERPAGAAQQLVLDLQRERGGMRRGAAPLLRLVLTRPQAPVPLSLPRMTPNPQPTHRGDDALGVPIDLPGWHGTFVHEGRRLVGGGAQGAGGAQVGAVAQRVPPVLLMGQVGKHVHAELHADAV